MPHLQEGPRRVNVGLRNEIIEVSRVDGEKQVKVWRVGGASTEHVIFSKGGDKVHIGVQQYGHGTDFLLNTGFALGMRALEVAVNELKSNRKPAKRKSPRKK